MKKRAGIYIRVSTEHQAKEGYSVAAQKNNLTNFSLNQGWEIFDIYADEGISGKNIKDRPEVKRMINDIKENKIDVVVLYKFDRLTRDSRDTEDIILLVQEYGIEVFTLSGGIIDVSTATGRFSIRINGAVAQLEREQTIERVKVAFKQKVNEGYTLASSIMCYGYDRKKHEKEQVINEKEAKIVKRIFNLYLDDKNFTQICTILNSEKIPTKLSGKIIKKRNSQEHHVINSIWTPKNIRLILTNPTYIGKVRYHIGKMDYLTLEGRHKSIISKNIWNKVQLKIKKEKSIQRTNSSKDDAYYCGILICGFCGEKMTTSRSTKKNKNGLKRTFVGYKCVNHAKKKCPCLGISQKKIETAFQDYIDNIKIYDDINQIRTNKKHTENQNKMNKNLKILLNKKKKILDLFLFDKISMDQFEYMTKKIDKDILFFNKEINDISSQKDLKIDLTKISNNLKDHWIMLKDNEKKEFIKNFIKKIVLINDDPNKIKGKIKILNVEFYE